MVNSAASFMFFTVAFYTTFRYFFQQNDFFKELAWVYVVSAILFLIFLVMAITTANRVSHEVNTNLLNIKSQ